MCPRFRAIVFAMALAPASIFAGEPTDPPQARRVAAVNPTCASDLGMGVKSRRRFCDVIIASTPAESVSVPLPPHSGAATLMFDLHNRFTVPSASVDPKQAFTSHVAVVAVIKLTGDVIDRAAVGREYRTATDLFDRIGGSGRNAAVRPTAPGHAQAVRITVPAGVNVVGIVGTRLEEWLAATRGTYDTPNKPIAIVSNLRVDYQPR